MLHFIYGTWYGATVLFLAVAVLFVFLPFWIDSLLPNSIIISKDCYALIVLVLFINILVSAIVSLFKRAWRQFVIKLLLIFPGIAVYLFFEVLMICQPTRMASSPKETWIETQILQRLPVEREQIKFCGGIDSREPIVVFEVLGQHHDLDRVLVPEEAAQVKLPKAYFDRLFARFREPITLAGPIRLRTCYMNGTHIINILEVDGRCFIICNRL